MKKIITFLLSSLFSVNLWSDPPLFATNTITLDFTKSHSTEHFKNSGMKFTDISNSSIQSFSYQNQILRLILPNGRILKQNVELGIADAKDNELLQLTTAGVIMPHDEAYKVATKIHRNLGLATDKLDQWYLEEMDKGRNAKGYSISANERLYPRVSMAIQSSMNEKYPWVIALKISWNWRKHEDWDEDRAARENPPPPPEYATISLEPPSGNVYARKDAYRDLHEADRLLVTEKQATATLTPLPKSELTSISKKDTDNESLPDDNQRTLIPIYFLAALGIAGIGSFIYFYIQRNRHK